MEIPLYETTKPSASEPLVSVVMPVYNAASYLQESIDSILAQSFTNFECIIIDDASTDDSREIIKGYTDERIILVENTHDFVSSLNLGISLSKGRYIARMDADDMMHPDRLKIQTAIMEAEPQITVCSSWIKAFGENKAAQLFSTPQQGVIVSPLLSLLGGKNIYHPTVMLRKKFLDEHQLQYQPYPYAEDMKLWAEIAKCGGMFYIESQCLLDYRISENQVSTLYMNKQQETTTIIQKEIIDWLLEQNKTDIPELSVAFNSLQGLETKGLIAFDDVFEIFQSIFYKNHSKLKLV